MKSKSRGLFPGPSSRPRFANKGGGSAGNSSGSGDNAPNTDGYKTGMLGDKASRMAGGQSGDDRLTDRPTASSNAIQGDGGFAYDASYARYYRRGI